MPQMTKGHFEDIAHALSKGAKAAATRTGLPPTLIALVEVFIAKELEQVCQKNAKSLFDIGRWNRQRAWHFDDALPVQAFDQLPPEDWVPGTYPGWEAGGLQWPSFTLDDIARAVTTLMTGEPPAGPEVPAGSVDTVIEQFNAMPGPSLVPVDDPDANVVDDTEDEDDDDE